MLFELVEEWSTTPAVREALEGVARCERVEDVLAELSAGVARVRDEWGDVIEVVLATAPHEPAVAARLLEVRGVYEVDVDRCVRRILHLTDHPEAHREVLDVLWFYFGSAATPCSCTTAGGSRPVPSGGSSGRRCGRGGRARRGRHRLSALREGPPAGAATAVLRQ